MHSHQRPFLHAFAAGIALCMAFGTASCSNGETEPNQQPAETKTEQTTPIEVVASINQWGSVAEQIGGSHVKVTSILSSTTTDAHDFEPKTKDVDVLDKAQVIVANGAGYDSWATKTPRKDAVSVSAAQMVGAVEGDNPHLWFSSDARNAMAKELADTYSRIMPKQRKYFSARLKAWNKRELKLEKDMEKSSKSLKGISYASTEPVAYYLFSDIGLTDKTPEGYSQSTADGSQPSSENLQEFQKLLEDHGTDLLVNNTQETSDATNIITGTAHKSDLPVIDISEQMPSDCKDLIEWTTHLITTLDEEIAKEKDKATDGTDETGSDTQPSDAKSDSGSKSSSESTTDGTSPDNTGQTDPGK